MRALERRVLALIGLRACGKSSVGRALAARLRVDFVDLDLELARSALLPTGLEGARTGEILSVLGESAFRDVESATLAAILARSADFVLATGGGSIERRQNRELLAERATCIWLRAEPELLAERLRRDPTLRPPLTALDPLGELRHLLARRERWYAELADCEIDAAAGEPVEVAERVLRAIAWPARGKT